MEVNTMSNDWKDTLASISGNPSNKKKSHDSKSDKNNIISLNECYHSSKW